MADVIVVDASCLYEVVTGTPLGRAIGDRMLRADDQAAPHTIDVEVLGVIRRDELHGRLDATAARHAVEDLASWPGERFDHRPFIPRAWELRATVRTWDAFYVAVTEALDASLLTCDARLAGVSGPECRIEVFGAP
jgi:predicted nucleic acid-binding protein